MKNYAQQLRDAANVLRTDPESVPVSHQLGEPLADWLEWEARWMEQHQSTDIPSGVNTVARVILNVPD